MRALKPFVVFAAVGAAVALAAAPASAHVTVAPASAPRGAEAVTLTFNVPNEKADATTTKVEIVMPEGKPFAFVSAEPVPGWTLSTTTTKLAQPIKSEEGDVTEAVSRVTWSGGSIGAGQFQQFLVAVGPLPDSGNSLEFKALQTYSDGDVVRWIESTPPGGGEPDHPAPTLELTGATGGRHGNAATPTTAGSTDGAAASDDNSSDDDSNGLAIAALAVGVVALAVGGAAVALARRSART